MSSWGPRPHLILGLPDAHSAPSRMLFCARGQSLWKYQNLVQGPQTLALRRDAPRSRTVHLGPFSPPSPGLSSARRSLHSRTASCESSVREATSVWGGGGSSLLAQNEWKPLRRLAGPNSGVQGARVRCHRLPGHPPTSVPRPHTHTPPPVPGFLPPLPSRGRALRGGVRAELAPRKGLGSCPAHVSGRGQTGKG